MGIPDLLTYLLRNLYAGQEATVKNWTWKNVLVQNWESTMSHCILLLFLFNLHAKHVMRTARLDEAYAGINFTGRNINNLRY